MPKNTNQHIVIIGAGLVGSLVAIYLRKRGYQVTIYERRDDMRKASIAGGRSINLALSNRGWKPLAQVGLEEEVSRMIIPMNGRMMHDIHGELTFQPYGKDGQAINSISRGGLNQLLIENAEKKGVKIFFEHACTKLDYQKSQVTLRHNDQQVTANADIIIGADGAYSAVRQEFQISDRFNYQQQYIDHGYKELNIPAGNIDKFRLEKNALHIWPRGNYMLIALPNTDGSFTCTLFFPFEGEKSFATLKSDADIITFFKEVFPDAVELMPTLLQDYKNNPTSSLVTIKCYPWVRHKTLIIGDASHAIVPFYGQGMNSGFEDCRVLNDMLDKYHDDWDTVLPLYQQMRKPDADAILDLALQNFIEMRDLVGDEYFLTRKKIEAMLHDKYPDQWIPLYSMVTFQEEMRYSEAIKIGKKQSVIMDEVMSRSNILDNWQSVDLEEIIKKLI